MCAEGVSQKLERKTNVNYFLCCVALRRGSEQTRLPKEKALLLIICTVVELFIKLL